MSNHEKSRYWLGLAETMALAWKREAMNDPSCPTSVARLIAGDMKQHVSSLQLTAILDWDWSIARRSSTQPSIDYWPKGL